MIYPLSNCDYHDPPLQHSELRIQRKRPRFETRAPRSKSNFGGFPIPLPPSPGPSQLLRDLNTTQRRLFEAAQKLSELQALNDRLRSQHSRMLSRCHWSPKLLTSMTGYELRVLKEAVKSEEVRHYFSCRRFSLCTTSQFSFFVCPKISIAVSPRKTRRIKVDTITGHYNKNLVKQLV